MDDSLAKIVDLETFDPTQTYLITHHPEQNLHYVFNLKGLGAPRTHSEYVALAELLLPLEKRFGEVIRIDRGEHYTPLPSGHALIGTTFVRLPSKKRKLP